MDVAVVVSHNDRRSDLGDVDRSPTGAFDSITQEKRPRGPVEKIAEPMALKSVQRLKGYIRLPIGFLNDNVKNFISRSQAVDHLFVIWPHQLLQRLACRGEYLRLLRDNF
jgi:hypothetical protein